MFYLNRRVFLRASVFEVWVLPCNHFACLGAFNYHSALVFRKGEPITELETRELSKNERRTGTVIRWRPDLEVFTDIAIPRAHFEEVLEKQAVVNAGIKIVLNI